MSVISRLFFWIGMGLNGPSTFVTWDTNARDFAVASHRCALVPRHTVKRFCIAAALGLLLAALVCTYANGIPRFEVVDRLVAELFSH